LLISSVFYKYRSFFFELKKVLITSTSNITGYKGYCKYTGASVGMYWIA
jgi:hypothetical protein